MKVHEDRHIVILYKNPNRVGNVSPRFLYFYLLTVKMAIVDLSAGAYF